MKGQEILNGSEGLFQGCPARSLAGHDKGQYFIVLLDEGEYVALVDGRIRTVQKPKWKKKKHVQMGRQVLIEEFPAANEVIRRELKNYVKSHCGN